MHNPDSAEINAATSSRRRVAIAAALFRIAARSNRVRVGRYAWAWAKTARTSSSVALGTVPMAAPV